MPTPSSVIIADVAGGTLNSSAANFSTAVNGVASGTLKLKIDEENDSWKSNKSILKSRLNFKYRKYCKNLVHTIKLRYKILNLFSTVLYKK